MSLLSDYTDSKFAIFPESASSFSDESDWIFHFISIVCIVFFIPIAVALFGFAWKYKKKKGQAADSQVDHNTTLELVWSIGPSFLLVVMFYFGAVGFLDHRRVPEGAYDVGVDAYKWGWGMNYGRGIIHPELHVVVDEPTKLTMTSKDVIHSLYIPAFRVKKDVVPGRYNYLWFKASRASEKVATDEECEQLKLKDQEENRSWDYDGRQFTPDGYKFYDLYCTEYCGTNHSEMQTVVVVHETREELEAWIKKYGSRGDQDPVVYGGLLYERRGCKSCHSIDGTRMIGPSYKGSFGTMRDLVGGGQVKVDENYIRESVIDPKAKVAVQQGTAFQPVMPSYKGQLTDDDIYSLAEFIKSLGDASAAEGDSAGEEEKSE